MKSKMFSYFQGRMFRYLLLIILLISTRLYAQPEHLYGKSYQEKYRYIDSLKHGNANLPTKAANREQLEQWAKENKDAELSAMLRLAAYEQQAGISGQDTAAMERELERMLDEYEDNKYVRADILQALGKFYLDIKRRNSHAFEYFLLAYNEYKDLSSKDFPPKRDYIYDLAGAYYRYEDYGNAIRYMNETLETPKEGEPGSNLTILNTIGLSYKELRKYDSAMLYLNKAYEGAKQKKDMVWVGILSGNIGEVYYQVKDNAKAIAKLEECLGLCLANNVKRNAVMAACRLAGVYLEQGNTGQAKMTLDRVVHLYERENRPEYHVAQRLYSVMARTYAASGNIALAYLYADSALRAKDSAYAEQAEINKVRAAEKAEYVQHKLKLSQVAHEKQRQMFIRNSLIIIIVLVTLLGLLFVNRQRLQKKKLVAELDAVTSKLINAREVSTVAEEHTAAAHKEEDAAAEAEALSKLESSSLLTNEQWAEFRKLFDKVHKGFLSNLKRKLPDLSQTDIRFIALTKLKLSSREMASMLGVSPSTIRIYKFRLRKKLGLDKEEDIEDLINKL